VGVGSVCHLTFFCFLHRRTSSFPNPPAFHSPSRSAADLIVFGATGFTGALVAEYLAEHYGTSPAGFTWAVAGRSASKLADLATALHAKAERAVATGKDSMGKDTQRGGAKLTAVRGLLNVFFFFCVCFFLCFFFVFFFCSQITK
jgi:hypothetical protein